MKKTLTLLFLTLSCHILNAQNLKLYDVTHGNNPKGPFSLHAGTDKLYFYAYDTTGYDVSLYSIDKKDNITQHTSTFRLWANTSPNATTVNNNVIFTYADTVGNVEPYILHPNGQYNLIEDLSPNFGSDPRYMTTLRDKVYFVAYDSNRRERLYEYDDKSGKVEDIIKGQYSGIRNLITFQDRIYFSMFNTSTGVELYTYDPKLKIFWRLSNMNLSGSDILQISINKNKLYYIISYKPTPYQYPLAIYEYDGIHAPSILPNSTVYGKQQYSMTVYNDAIYFNPIRPFADNLLRYNLLNNNMEYFPDTKLKEFKYFTEYHGKLYLHAFDNDIGKTSLYYYDGTQPIVDLNLPVQDPRDLTVFNDNLYFVAQSDDSTVGTEIFRFNDSALTIENVLSPLSDIQLYPNPTSGNIQLQFSSKENRDLEIIVTDIQGRIVYTEKEQAYAGTNSTISIPCISFVSGTYICTIKDNSGRLLLTKKFVKQ